MLRIKETITTHWKDGHASPSGSPREFINNSKDFSEIVINDIKAKIEKSVKDHFHPYPIKNKKQWYVRGNQDEITMSRTFFVPNPAAEVIYFKVLVEIRKGKKEIVMRGTKN